MKAIKRLYLFFYFYFYALNDKVHGVRIRSAALAWQLAGIAAQ